MEIKKIIILICLIIIVGCFLYQPLTNYINPTNDNPNSINENNGNSNQTNNEDEPNNEDESNNDSDKNSLDENEDTDNEDTDEEVKDNEDKEESNNNSNSSGNQKPNSSNNSNNNESSNNSNNESKPSDDENNDSESGTNKPGSDSDENEDDENPEEPQKPTQPVLGITEEQGDDININRSGNNFFISGTIEAREKNDKFATTSYIELVVTSQKMLTTEQYQNMTVTHLYNNLKWSQKDHKILKGLGTNNVYFTMYQEFMTGEKYSIVVDWGDGDEITYTFSFDVDVK